MSKYFSKRGPINEDGDEELEYRWIREQTRRNIDNEYSPGFHNHEKAEADAMKSWKAGHWLLDP